MKRGGHGSQGEGHGLPAIARQSDDAPTEAYQAAESPSALRHCGAQLGHECERHDEQHRKGRPPYADPGWVRIQPQAFDPQSRGGEVRFEVATPAAARGDGDGPVEDCREQ